MLVAAKRMEWTGSADSTLLQEIKMLFKYRHENIVTYLGSTVVHSGVRSHVWVITEYVAGGSLEALLDKFKALQPSAVQRYTRDIVKGLAYLHKRWRVRACVCVVSVPVYVLYMYQVF